MKRILFTTISVFIYVCLSAQKTGFIKPDYEKIKKEIQDSTSVYYYPELMSRFNAFDATLKTEDFRYLYYGYIFNKNYDPLWVSPYREDLNVYYNKKELEKSDYNSIIYIGNKSLMNFPFDLVQIDFIVFSYHMLGDKEKEKGLQHVFLGLVSAILSSGDGESCETGYHVININHEYELLKISRLDAVAQKNEDNCDVFVLDKNDRGKKAVFFDISRMIEAKAKMNVAE
jgi:hypothetical protein